MGLFNWISSVIRDAFSDDEPSVENTASVESKPQKERISRADACATFDETLSQCSESEQSEPTDYSDWEYDSSYLGVRITRYKGSDTEVTVPESINGDKVVCIGSEAFSGKNSSTNPYYKTNSRITSIVVPDSVTTIESSAFEHCSSLKRVVLPPVMKEICSHAFFCCYELEEITLPDGIKEIGSCLLFGCRSLKEIVIPESVQCFKYRSFTGCTGLTSFYVPKNVSDIGQWFLEGCDNLTNIYVDPENKHYCDVDGIVYSCDRTILVRYPVGRTDESYTVPDGVQTLAEMVFSGCKQLRNIVIPSSVKYVGDNAFTDCTRLAVIEFCSCPDMSHYTIRPFSELKELIVTGIPIAEWKYQATIVLVIIGFVKAIYDGREFAPDIYRKNEEYIRSMGDKLYQLAIENSYLLRYMLEKRMIPIENIGQLLEMTDDIELKAQILEYRGSFTQDEDPGFASDYTL